MLRAFFFLVLCTALPKIGHAYTCEQVITAEGIFKRAQTECPIPAGPSPFEKAAATCSRHFSPEKVSSLTRGGYYDWFDAHTNDAATKAETCKHIAASTPIDPESVKLAVPSSTIASTLGVPGKCLLQVDGRIYLNGPCKIDMQGGGDFMISAAQNVTAGYFASVHFASVHLDKVTGTAIGFWNGRQAESHAHDDLGTLRRKGACWSNSRATVCAATSKPEKDSSNEVALNSAPAEGSCRNRQSLSYVDQSVSSKLGMHIDPSTAQVSPYAGPNNGKIATVCLVTVPALGISVIYSVKVGSNGYSTEIIGP